MSLNQEEITACHAAFSLADESKSGRIDVWGLKTILATMGHTPPTDKEIFQLMQDVDNTTGTVTFVDFLRIIEIHKERTDSLNSESDLIDAFVACGGEEDKSGHVTREKIIQVIKHDFGLTIDIEVLISKVDTDGSGEIEFEEFKELLSGEL